MLFDVRQNLGQRGLLQHQVANRAGRRREQAQHAGALLWQSACAARGGKVISLPNARTSCRPGGATLRICRRLPARRPTRPRTLRANGRGCQAAVPHTLLTITAMPPASRTCNACGRVSYGRPGALATACRLPADLYRPRQIRCGRLRGRLLVKAFQHGQHRHGGLTARRHVDPRPKWTAHKRFGQLYHMNITYDVIFSVFAMIG